MTNENNHTRQPSYRSAEHENGTSDPALIVRTYKGSNNASAVTIHGPSQVVYRPLQPLSCGARAWIETQSEVSYE